MQFILVSNRLATARSITISWRIIVAAVAAVLVLSLAMSFFFSWLGVQYRLPFVTELVSEQLAAHQKTTETYVRDNVGAMAVKLGEIQAQVMRLESIGERLSKTSGIPMQKPAAGKDGQGGPLIGPQRPLSAAELQREIDRLGTVVEDSTDALMALESQLMERRIKSSLLPTMTPIVADHIGSAFGRRIDPIAGVGAMHEGIDLVADVGTKVVAAAGGVVQTAEFHPDYGNIVEIDHGNDFSSRYAHLSRINVKPGQVIRRGQAIALSGNTGRSTGPHLHFEVRFKGVAQNPGRFLAAAENPILASADPEKLVSSSVSAGEKTKSSGGRVRIRIR